MRRRIAKMVMIAVIISSAGSLIPQYAAAQDVTLKLARVLAYQKKYDESLVRYRQYLKRHPKDYTAHMEAGDVYFWNRQYRRARASYERAAASPRLASQARLKIADIDMNRGRFDTAAQAYRTALADDPDNAAVRLKLAQVLSYSGAYNESIEQYERVLDSAPDNEAALRGLAEVLSWDERYDESLAAYDRLLAHSYNADDVRQKARVLGWAKQFEESLRTYDDAYARTGKEVLYRERMAKQAYWNGWVKTALRRYRALLNMEPLNNEARSDLAQLEGYQRMWAAAAADFTAILDSDTYHFRARDGLDRVRVLRDDILVAPEFRYLRARSSERNVHMNWLHAGARSAASITDQLSVVGGYAFDYFMFDDDPDIPRHQGLIGIDVNFSPDIWASAYYLPTAYTSDDRFSSLFLGEISGRPVDPIVISAFTERADLVNNIDVFRNEIRTTDIGGRINASIHRRWKAMGEYRYGDLNDGNRRNAFAVENLLYILFEPTRLTANVRFDFQDYHLDVPQYFSPDNFWGAEATFHWRQYLNPHGLYFGALDTYYGVKYRLRVDREREVFNGGALEFYRDFSHRMAINAEAFGIYGSVYYDVGAAIRLIGRF